jgi:hypothetical protein
MSYEASVPSAVRPSARSGDHWESLHPESAYSESREAALRRCPRSYFHATYTSWRGWSAAPATDAWLAYRCKNCTPLAAAFGSVVHEAAARCVRALRAGRRLPTLHDLRREAGAALNAMWTNSRSGRQRFLRRLSDLLTPMLQEMLYREGPSAEALRRAREKLNRTLANLVACEELWAQVAATDAVGVIIPERFLSFRLMPEGITVYAAPDLVLAQPGERPVIVDFKTSAADGGIDQLLTYSVAARDAFGLNVSDGCVGAVAALDASPEERVARCLIFPEEIKEAADRIRRNVATMRGYLADQATNAPKPMEAFAQARDAKTCRGCAYRAVCWPEFHSIDAPGERDPSEAGYQVGT